MSRAVLSVGSNLGDRSAALGAVATAFAPWIRAASGIWQTPPWGPVQQDDFLNAVLIVDDPDTDPTGWLVRGQECERASGRVRDVHWGPRSLDVDVVTVDDEHSSDPVLTLPHPHAHERAFVLAPWLDADPDAVLPGRGSVRELLAALPSEERAGVVRIADASWADVVRSATGRP